MCWAAFSRWGTTSLAFTSSKMKSGDYIRLLEGHLLPYMRKFQSVHFTYQQDNASIHVRETKDWLRIKNIQTLPHPACSPDLNPIENLWGILVRDVYAESRQFETVNDLKAAILEAWGRISGETIINLVGSMHGRMLDVLERQGKHIDK